MYSVLYDRQTSICTFSLQSTVAKLGGLDILVLNHILQHSMGEWRGSSENLTLFDRLIDINFRAYVYLSAYAMSYLENSKGSIVAVSSIAGELYCQLSSFGDGWVFWQCLLLWTKFVSQIPFINSKTNFRFFGKFL